jgi:hypothetical protein
MGFHVPAQVPARPHRPATIPWIPRGSADVRFFINQIVLGEECDDTAKLAEAKVAARAAVQARIVFWDGVQAALT